MASGWGALRESLLRSIRNLQADRQFEMARMEEEVLERFGSADALLAYLATGGGDLDEKDRVYAVFVRAVQAKADWRDLATSLLWLGLWPGLDATYRRRLRSFADQPQALVAEIGFIFTTMVARIDLSGVSRLAATLVMSVERDVREGLKRSRRDQKRLVDVETLADDLSDPRPIPCDRHLPIDADDLAAVRAWLLRVVARDAGLLIDVILRGFDEQEAGKLLGISHEAARKRYQRALKRLQESLLSKKKAVPVRRRKLRLEGGGQIGGRGREVQGKKLHGKRRPHLRLVDGGQGT